MNERNQAEELPEPPKPYSIRRAAFLDILGFREIVSRTESDPLLLSRLNAMLHSEPGRKRLLEYTDYFPRPDGKTLLDLGYRVSSFSDSILISAPRENEHVTFLLYLCYLSCAYFPDGFLFRGGALAHLLVHEDDLVFGPALQAAYKLEADRAKSLGLEPIAYVGPSASAGVDPAYMGLGPIPAIRKVLARADTSLSGIDLVEINEAFAAQSVACARELKIDDEKLNVNGGAIAIGHPLGCSGARIATTLIHEMKRRGAGRGIASLCVGVGQGLATVFDRV